MLDGRNLSDKDWEETMKSKEEIIIETVNLKKGKLPADFVGKSKFSKKYLGELIRKDGTNYSWTERHKYYSKAERPHPAKTPLHVARWAIQAFSKEGDWVLDPTMGVGTTAVESLRQKRNVAGMELEYIKAIDSNIEINNPFKMKIKIVAGDARTISRHISKLDFSLVVNNPPYSGDQRQYKFAKKIDGKWEDTGIYYLNDKNLGILKENKEYWDSLRSIYSQCISRMKTGGHLVIGVKDMMRNKKPFVLHEMIGDLLLSLGLKFEGMALLRHHPATLNMRSYRNRFKIEIPLYQVILVFKK